MTTPRKLAHHRVGTPSERRRHERQLALLRVALLHAGGVSDICVVRNISASGLSARAYRPLKIGEAVDIEFRSGERLSGTVVWERERDVGVAFPEPIDVAAVLSNTRTLEPSKRRALPRIKVECRGGFPRGCGPLP
ncbi:PilZ domain-containing protein [Sphingomonas daechungensis]|uniref:PilZ domain-containing protein n=1 Tax=Sphingomonas daechungensis TaxID=1176646 RepID=A0ABX6T408_9SPHN|nr:PilZ domain-containing protein [Sphingomonas daechungensis]QNP42393.1 PilZ domain-containing protein [Sphingomonas daechungensis]